MALALAGRFDASDTHLFDYARLATLDIDKYPDGFLALVEASRQEMLEICEKINALVSHSRNEDNTGNETLIESLDTLRGVTATLLQNHVTIAKDLTQLEQTMPAHNSKTKVEVVQPLEAIAKKMKVIATREPIRKESLSEKTPLVQPTSLNEQDIQTIKDVQQSVSSRFTEIQSEFAEQDKKIEALEANAKRQETMLSRFEHLLSALIAETATLKQQTTVLLDETKGLKQENRLIKKQLEFLTKEKSSTPKRSLSKDSIFTLKKDEDNPPKSNSQRLPGSF